MAPPSLVALAWTPWALTHWPAHISGETWSCVATLSVVCTAGAFLTFFALVKEVGSTRAVVVTYFNTAIAVVLGIVGLNEPLTAGILVGFPLVIVGCVIATSRPRLALGLDLVGRRDFDHSLDHEPHAARRAREDDVVVTLDGLMVSHAHKPHAESERPHSTPARARRC